MTREFDSKTALANIRSELAAPATRVGWGAATVLLSLMAPFEMAESTSFIGRFFYWSVLIGISLVAAIAAKHSVAYLFPHLAPLHALGLTALLFASVFTPIIYLTNYIILPNRWDSLSSFAQMFGFVIVVFLCVAVIILVVQQQYAGVEPEEEKLTAASFLKSMPNPEPDSQPLLLDRLDYPLKGGRIIRLSMQDHYVEVHTDLGAQLILMRMSDAIDELNGIDGMQVHRSHWVALEAVTGKRREKGRIYLQTSDGAKVPVSRSYTADAREAGLV